MTILQEREQRGIEEGIELGMQKGELKRARKTTKNMLLDGETIEKIMRYTGLNEEEIEEVKREMLN